MGKKNTNIILYLVTDNILYLTLYIHESILQLYIYIFVL